MSLRLRLALWYGALTGLVVLLVGLFTYALHTRAHYDDLDRALSSASTHMSGEYSEAGSLDALKELLAVPVAPNVAARAYGPDGRVLAAGPNATFEPPVDPRRVLDRPPEHPYDPLVRLAPSLVRVPDDGGTFSLVSDTDGNRWRLHVVTVDGPARYLVVASPLERIDASVARFRMLIALLTALGAAATLVVGWLIAGRALRPVATLTETAGGIARSREFDRRVQVETRHDEMGKLAKTFNEMLASLEEAYQAQKRFVADASHELRAPLTAIQGNLELLKRHPDKPPAEQREAVNEANREAGRLAHLVADLLALARADAGVSLRRQRVELDRVLLDSFSAARHLACGQSIEIGALEPSLVEGDPDRLKELFLILLDNALRYTPDGGRITLELRRNGKAAEVTVRDTGVGIAPDDLPRVFERFYRADPARARDPGGTGLGLSIARWISEQHGGEIELKSEPGEGTTVTVRLPLHP